MSGLRAPVQRTSATNGPTDPASFADDLPPLTPRSETKRRVTQEETGSVNQQTGHPRFTGSSYAVERAEDSTIPTGIGTDDFNFLRVVGRGAYAVVWEAVKLDTRQVYAIKVLDKVSRAYTPSFLCR
jgi:hypothetical protein